MKPRIGSNRVQKTPLIYIILLLDTVLKCNHEVLATRKICHDVFYIFFWEGAFVGGPFWGGSLRGNRKKHRPVWQATML